MVLEIGSKRYGILNIYAPNKTSSRSRFWISLLNFNFPDAHWIVAGDFNMTENEDDRSPDYAAKAMGARESQAWTRFALRLGINDVFYLDEFRRIGTKRHTWCRDKPTSIWSRLDRFYIDGLIQSHGGRHGIWPTMNHISDHAAAFLSITLTKPRTKGHIPFNNALLKDQHSLSTLTDCWKQATAEQPGSSTEKVVNALTAIKHHSDKLTRQQKKEGRATYEAQFAEIRAAEMALRADWNDLDAWSRLN